MTQQLHQPDDSSAPAFESPEGLRALLVRLHEAGPGSWRHDKDAHELSSYIARKYSRLARKHGLNPWEAVTLAFEAMLQDSVRTAKNPWAAVTAIVKWPWPFGVDTSFRLLVVGFFLDCSTWFRMLWGLVDLTQRGGVGGYRSPQSTG